MARHCNLWSYLRSDQSFFHSNQGTYWPQTKCSANSCCSSPNKRSAIWNCSNAGAMCTTILRSLQGRIWGVWFACCNCWFPISETGTPNSISTPFEDGFIQFHSFRAVPWVPEVRSHCHLSAMSSNQNSLAYFTLTQSKKLQGMQQTNIGYPSW